MIDLRPDARVRSRPSMLDRLTHRGPDGAGAWERPGLWLGHRRLAILDLSPTGAQPMTSADGRYTIVFNGELYDHRTLRAELVAAGHRLRGTSDTEVLLELVARHGVERTFGRINAMYGVAIWDEHEEALWLARDPAGEKSVYVWRNGTAVVFASELGAITALPEFADDIDIDARATYFLLGYIPAPMTIYRNVRKLLPGQWLRISAGGERRGQTTPAVPEGLELEATLRDAVALRMVADVPVGVFLSGGIDSTVIAGLAAQHGNTNTFTAAFDEASHDESEAAATVAAALGTEHTTLHVAAADGLRLAEETPRIYGEPFADPSSIPTQLIAAAAREHVVVALTGDGGDELFCGYNRLLAGRRVEAAAARVPRPLRRAAAASVRQVPARAFDAVGRWTRPANQAPLRSIGDKVHKAATLFGSDADASVRAAVALWPDPVLLVDGTARAPLEQGRFTDDLVEHDRDVTLPEQMLVKVDRASMRVALETRPPLLDPRVVSIARRTSIEDHVADGVGKAGLRRIASTLVDPALLDRPKMGFDPPIAAWLRGPLRAWADGLLSPAALAETGIRGADVIRQTWSRHLRGRVNEDYRLWSVLQYQQWFFTEHRR